MSSFKLILPQTEVRPVLVSVPHCGQHIPDSIRQTFHPMWQDTVDDTDWFVDQLYDFCPQMGITMMCAHYHRWVVDLNRDPTNTQLYHDGRIISGLVPEKSFSGEAIYLDHTPDETEVARRVKHYYQPYHDQLGIVLDDLKTRFKHVLLFEAHSIRHHVPLLHPEPFTDLILGSNESTSAHSALIETAKRKLSHSPYGFAHNVPFKGGYITRHFGQPSQGIHALQLEMTQKNYMDEDKHVFDIQKAQTMSTLLKDTLGALCDRIQSL